MQSPRRASSVSPEGIFIPFFYGEERSEGHVIAILPDGHLVCVLEEGTVKEVSLLVAMETFEFLDEKDIDTLDLLAEKYADPDLEPWEEDWGDIEEAQDLHDIFSEIDFEESPQENLAQISEEVGSEDPLYKQSREKGEFSPPGQRGGREGQPQHVQLPQKKRQDARRYKSTPKRKRDSQMYYHLVCKRSPKCMQRREEYRERPEKYKRRKSPLREAAALFVEELRIAGDVILFDQDNPSNNEIKQPGKDVGYEATSPTNYSKSPDKKDGVPQSHQLPNQHHDDASPSSSRVIPDSMKENLQDSLTYMGGGQHINAAAISPSSLSPDIKIHIVKTQMGKGGWKVTAYSETSGAKLAHISFSKPLGSGPCLGAYEVQNSWSDLKGLGPLMYDIALELAGTSGLMSDRREVSPDALRVWATYMNSRSDIKAVQLDSFYGTENDDPEDDCKNSSAGVNWLESPLSKVYYKRGTPFIEALRGSGAIVDSPPVKVLKSAALISEIFSNCSPDLIEKSRGVQYDRKSLRPNGMSVWTAQGSKNETYTIRVKPVPKNKSIKAIAKMPVQVSCTCPFFRWQGPEHWAKTHSYLYGKPEGSATKPSNKDPSGKHWACKHVLAVLDLVKKHRIANMGEFSWEGELTPFPDSVFSPEQVASRWASGNRFVSVGAIRTGSGSAQVVYDPEVTRNETAVFALRVLKSVPSRELAKSAARRFEIYDNPEDVTRRLDEVGIEDYALSNGAFDFSTGTVYACTWDGYKDSSHTLLHELGHSIVGRDEGMAEAWYENYR